ncbi:MAG: DUF2461 domain-containing protein [Prevotella sp.]|nr:DUF2461 domain-containing protein [Prevotella sp.]
MDSLRIISFLKQVAANNNRPWFNNHKDEYLACKSEFESGIEQAIARITGFDSSVAHITVKDATYRFYRDTRFSEDKSPYKNHMGAYISAHGKKSLHGGYYIHIEPDHCMLSVGSYWLPTNILTSCRNEIMANIDEWRRCVENKDFVNCFGKPAEGKWGSPKGFGLEHLRGVPKGFPGDYEFIDYLRMKDYCVWTCVPDNFFTTDTWLDEMERVFKIGKPMMDFMNAVIDDYE